MTDDYDIEREEAQYEHDMEQLDRIAELERVNSEYMDINHEQGMQLIESHKRIAELESLVRDMWFKNIGRMDYCGWCVIGCDNEENCELAERMDELGLMEVER